MAHDFISLAIIAVVAFVAPVIAQAIPKKPIPETVLLLAFGAILGPNCINHIWLTEPITLLSDLGLAFLFLLAGYEINPKMLTGTEGKKGLRTWLRHLRIRAGARVLASEFGHRRHRSGSHGHRACDHGARNAHAHFARARAHEYESRPRGHRIRHLGRSRPGARHGGAALHAHELADCSDSRRIHDPVRRHRPRARHGAQKRHAPLQISRSKSKHHLANIRCAVPS